MFVRRGGEPNLAVGGREQLVTLARALRGEHRVAADDEALAGEVGAGDLDEITLVEETLETVKVPRKHGGAPRRKPERLIADAIEAAGLHADRCALTEANLEDVFVTSTRTRAPQ